MSDASLLQDASHIFRSALEDCVIEHAFERKIHVETAQARTILHAGQAKLDLTDVRHLRIVAAGKASAEMLSSLLSRLPASPAREVAGVLIARDQPARLPSGFAFFPGGHPLPNRASFDGARAALDLVHEAATLQDAGCVFLVSGGASAMMELPLDLRISLEETTGLYQLLVHSGATIAEINCIRKHFSAVKGGRLAIAAGATPGLTLLVSDVAPRSLDCLASGPTMPDPSTVRECRELLARYRLLDSLPRSVRDYFDSPALEETPKPGPTGPCCVLLDSDDLAAAARSRAQALDYDVVVDNTCDDWSCTAAAEYLLERLRTLRTRHRRLCLLSTGEVVVRVPDDLPAGSTHRGGRNQHFALHAATLLTAADRGVAILSAGSDGIDGNSGAAGAVVDANTLYGGERPQQARAALDRFDSSSFLDACGATVVTGPTGNNLRDLRILLTE